MSIPTTRTICGRTLSPDDMFELPSAENAANYQQLLALLQRRRRIREFIRHAIYAYINGMEKGENWVNYDAPLAIYFYGSPYTDPADPLIAATTAMYAAESLGLGTCMLGAIHPLIQNGGKAKKFRKKYGIKYLSREGIFVIFGYPAVEYKKGLKRSFASVTIVNDE